MNEVKVFDTTGQELEAIKLGLTFPSNDVDPKTYACAIRVLLQNWRQGTVGCKSRGEVSFSNKKPWRQKGTGRARAGSARSPLWRKGGVTFGPQARTKMFKINQKQRMACLRAQLQSMLTDNAIYCVDCNFEEKDVPRTKDALNVLKKVGVADKRGILFLPYHDTMNFAAFRNLSRVGVLSFDQPNAFDLSGTQYWMFLKRDLALFKEMVAKWM